MMSRNRQLVQLLLLLWLSWPLQGCIGDVYHSIKSNLDISLDARDRDRLTVESEILAIYHEPWTSLPTQGEARRYSPITIEDPLQIVKDQFLSTVSGELRLTNVRALGAQQFPHTLLRKHYPIEVSKLTRTFGHGLVLEFQTTSWALDVYGDEKWWQFTMTNADAPALLSYMARARLVDLDLEKVLWQANCDAHTERHTAEEWVANQHELLKTKRDEVAAHCAHQLIDKFLETPPRSNASPS
jgi:hypothetical protein